MILPSILNYVWSIFSLSVTDELSRLTLCGIYYYFWIHLIPRWKGYEHRQTIVKYDDGAITHKIVRVPKADLVAWDEQHDAAGGLRHVVAH